MKNFYFIHEPSGCWPRCFVAYMLYPRPLLNAWKNSCYLSRPWLDADQPSPCPEETLYFIQGDLPFEPPTQRLPAGLSVIDPQRPVVFKITNPNGLERGSDGEGFSWIGTQLAELQVWSPRSGQAILTFTAITGPSLPETPRRRLRVTQVDGEVRDFQLGESGQVSIQLSVNAGVSQLQMQCLDQPTVYVMSIGDTRPILVGMSKARIDFLPPLAELPTLRRDDNRSQR